VAGKRSKPRVLIAGGGVAAAEALLALRDLAGDHVEIELLAPEPDFVYRPLAVVAPFDLGEAPRFALAPIVSEFGASHRLSALAEVKPNRRVAITSEGEELPYDVLVVATGAEAEEALPGALTYRGSEDGRTFAELLDEIERGDAAEVVFAVPRGVSWPLPLYELALITAGRLAAWGSVARLTFVTPEEAPLALFGRQASEAVGELLRSRGIDVRTFTYPVEFTCGVLSVVPEGVIRADRVVALPRLRGRPPVGLPRDADGFLPVDAHGLVRGLSDVYAAGDATAFPVKQGGIAAQQADAVAEAIAAHIGGFGAPDEPAPFRPVLRGVLLTGEGARYMRAEVTGGRGERSEVSTEMLWCPEGKIAARYLTHYLARRASPVEPARPLPADAIPVDVEITGPAHDPAPTP
jgi:sulfide:quinone oxidoreductase